MVGPMARGEAIAVECYAGYKAEQEPRAFTLAGQRRRVLGIADRWYGPDADYFKVRADDGHGYLLRRDRSSGEWRLAQVFPAHG